MKDYHSNMVYERYCDDIVIHTRSLEQSRFILKAVTARMAQYKLTLNQEKTKIVYCYRTSRLRKESKDIPCAFDFLGYTFKPRMCRRSDGETFWGFLPAISTKNKSRVLQEIKRLNLPWTTYRSLTDIATLMRPKLLGWVHYYGRHRPEALQDVFSALNHRLTRYIQNRHKFSSYYRARRRLDWIVSHFPNLFVHWQYGYTS